MKLNLFQEIEIPTGIEVTIDEDLFTAKGPEGELKRRFNIARLDFVKKDNKIIIGNKKATRMEKKMMNSIIAHIKNMFQGVQEKFEYKLKICYSHFPFTVEFKDGMAIIKNFLGEKIPRNVKMPEGAEIKMEKEFITITSMDKELAGQASANLEKVTKITGRDKRVFQDGIYITSKAGREM
jgi:large subunit ribosomal protein L6